MTDWQEIVARHSDLVWRTAYRMLGRYEDASDCLQEAFLAAWEISKSQRVRSWPALLVRLATRRALDRLRRRLRLAGRSQDVPDWSALPAKDPSPHEQATASELSQRLREALGQLTDSQAEVFCMRCLNDMSYKDIARQLDMEVSAVGVLLHRARGRLRELLQPSVNSQRAEVEP